MIALIKGEIDKLVEGQQLEPANLSKVLDQVAIAEKMVADVKKLAQAQAREQISAGAEIPGFTMTKGRTNRSVPDPIALQMELKSKGHEIDPAVWYASCKMGITELKTLLKGLDLKGKALEKVIDDAKGVKTSTGQPILKRK